MKIKEYVEKIEHQTLDSKLSSIEWFEWLYWINRSWDIVSLKFRPWKILKQSKDWHWYPMVELRKDWKRCPRMIHRLVAKAFIPNPNSLPLVMHIDDDITNYSICNLMWWTRKDNQKDMSWKWRWNFNKYHPMRNAMKISKLDNKWVTVMEFASIRKASIHVWIDNKTMKKYIQNNHTVDWFNYILNPS